MRRSAISTAAAALLLAAACAPNAPLVLDPAPGTRSADCAPLVEGPTFPVYPGASLAGGIGTTMNPGMNTSVSLYVVDAPLDDVAAFYQGCGGKLELVGDAIRFPIEASAKPGAPEASAYVELSERADGTHIAVHCVHCY